MRLEGHVAQMLLDDEIRAQVKPHIKSWMFETEVYRAFSMSILEDKFDTGKLDINVLLLTIKSKYNSLTNEDLDEINNLIDTTTEISKEDRPYTINIIQEEFIKKKMYWKATELLSLDKLEEAEIYFNNVANLNINYREYVNLADHEKLCTLLEAKFPKDGKYIKSSFGIINNSSTFKGYRRGDLCMICSPPGRGKTAFLCQEAATFSHQDFKVGFAVLGDNEEDDIAVKVCSFLSKTPISEVIENLKQYIEENEQYIKRINTIAYPSGCVGVRELLSDFKVIKEKEGLDILIVDYDANIAQSHDSMYESGGLIYSALKAFAQIEKCVVIVASQPKQNYWKEEILDLSCANESSKKQHAIDMMFTFNCNEECKKIGIGHIAKIRRGNTGTTVKLSFNFNISEIVEITDDEYKYILNMNKSISDSDDDDDLEFDKE